MLATTELIDSAQHFAEVEHYHQKYGDKPYTYHLGQVVSIVREYATEDREYVIAAAWLHDVLEDTDTTYCELGRKFGPTVANIVWACTGVGNNRVARQRSILSKIGVFYGAAIVKAADRLANMEENLKTGNIRKANMYCEEFADFFAVVEQLIPTAFADRLQSVHTKLLQMVNNDKNS